MGGKGPRAFHWLGLPLPDSTSDLQWASAGAAGVPASIVSAMARASGSVVPFLSISAIAEASWARLASRKAGSRQRSLARQLGIDTAPTPSSDANASMI